MIGNGIIYGGSDTSFHFSRLLELKDSFSHFNFLPQLSMDHFTKNGSAVMALYPYINLIPYILISFLIRSYFVSFLVYFVLEYFLCLIISYYASFLFSHNYKTSYLFSISYSLSSLFFSYNFRNMDFGATGAMIAFPLVIFGFMNCIKKSNWIELTTGMSLVIMSHVLSSIVVVLFLISGIIINWKEINKNNLIALFKAFLVTLLITACFWMNVFSFMLENHIFSPSASVLSGVGIKDMIFGSLSYSYSLDKNVPFGMGIFALIGLIVCAFYFRKFDRAKKNLYIIALLFTFIGSNLFPWNLFSDSFVRIIQFPWRVFIIPQLILSYLLSNTITNYIKFKYRNKIFVFSILAIIILQSNFQHSLTKYFVSNGSSKYRISRPVTTSSPLPFNVSKSLFTYSMSNSNEVLNVGNGTNYFPDYLPKSSINEEYLLNHDYAIDNNKNTYYFNDVGNGRYEIKINKSGVSKLSLPFVVYNNINYEVYLDNKYVDYYADRNKLMNINNVSKGRHIIKIRYNSPFKLLSIFTSILGMIIFLFYVYLNHKRKNA